MTELNDTFTFKIGEKEITIIMYAGLLRKLISVSKMLTEPDAFMLDMDVQEKFVDLLLTEFDEHGKEKGKFAEQFSLPQDILKDLTVWGYNHCVNFTVSTGTRLTEMLNNTTQALKTDSQHTPTG